MPTTKPANKVWILRNAKSDNYWLIKCIVFDTEKLLKNWLKKWNVKAGQVYLESELKYKIEASNV